MSMFNDISWRSRDSKVECESNANLVSVCAKRFGTGQWSFLVPGSKKKWYSISADDPQGECDRIAEKMMVTLAECEHPVFRATSPLSRGQLTSKGDGKLSIHYCADLDTITTVFHTITSVNQFSLYGAVAEMCEEYETFHDRTGQPVVGGQSGSSFVPSVIKTEVLFWITMTLLAKIFYCNSMKNELRGFSQQNKLSKFCMDAGILKVVEIGQYFMTKDIAEFSQFRAAVCRQYMLQRDEEASEPTNWIRENFKIKPAFQAATCCLHCKNIVEIGIMFLNQDNSH